MFFSTQKQRVSMSFRAHFAHFLLAVLLISPTASSSAPSHPQRKVPGVGFSLTPDYGTAAIYFQNGSSVSVARIEGSPAYKSFMRKHDDRENAAEEASAVSSLRSSVCRSIQPLSLPVCKREPDFASVQGLLRSLQSSVNSYLGATFCFAGIAVPDRNRQYHNHVIEESLKSIGLRQTHQILDAPRLVLVANNIDSSESPGHKSQAVLSVDYSASGLNVALFAEDAGVADIIRRNYSQHLGGDHQSEHGHLEAVEDVLKDITKPPFGDDLSGSPITDEVRQVVLFGDLITDPGFRRALERVVGSKLVEEAHGVNPVFAAALGMAKSSHERMDDLDFDVQPALGCRWFSDLYAAGREDL
ncbi:hypothetical protein CkaCkLH20_04178 [Colletotrichum karsti]|uniref:Uncharacterized protein n=1 Tax=Colletotrichum karsti TaxID=1095194 RepID=A0A9P6IG48_9PEZI|nr:uncharacterized protein CkaCkLH20_04178 [Colletotrichum karsti]KAF9878140.1 hypothetical protein CkaCkLH20_04178 [Colletotrichum karsti]